MTIESAAGRLSAEGVAFAPQIAGAAARHHLDPNLLAAVAAQETGCPGSNAGRNVVGDGGHGHGVFQIDDRYHDFASTAQAMDPAANADYAASMLSGLLGQYGGNVREALSAYNAGDPHASGTETTWDDGSTLDYADSVLRHYAMLGGNEPLAPPYDPSASSAMSLAQMPQLSQMPQPPSTQQPQSYHRQTTDYTGLIDGDGDES